VEVIKRECNSWWANRLTSYQAKDFVNASYKTSCSVVRFYKSKVSKMELIKHKRAQFFFGFNVFAHKDTHYVTDTGWSKLTDLMILANGGGADIDDDEDEELTEVS
jgi:hypothetical protein